jgi:trimeric autotransporter adhesin
MKQNIFTFFVLSAICFSACQKEAVRPVSQPTGGNKTVNSKGLNQDSVVMDTVKGYMHLQLSKDASTYDNIMINFDPHSKAAFDVNEDARTFQGFGPVSLSSLSSDHIACAINTTPLSSKGLTIGLAVNAKASGTYNLSLLKLQLVPDNYDIWLKDGYTKDSLDFRHNPTYAFDLNTSDSTSFGSHRFSLVMRFRQ